MRLFWRIFLVNAAVLVAAALVLAESPATVSASITAREAAILAAGLVVMLLVNGALLHRVIRPLERLADSMREADLLEPGRRLRPAGARELSDLIATFNAMLERLEHERRESAQRIVAAQEEERRRVASALHDEIGQNMTAVLLHLRRARALSSGEAAEECGRAQEAARSSLDEVRAVAKLLSPSLLDDLGLRDALAELCSAVASAGGIRVVRSLETPPELSRDAQLALYRVAQESLTNVIRHAGATRVAVGLRRTAAGCALEIVDDGRGMEGCTPGAGVRTLVRQGLRLLLDGEPDLAVVAEAADGSEAVALGRSGGFDLAILDVAMPRLTGLQAAAELRRQRPELRILMLSMYDHEQYLLGALRVGASGYVLKSAADDDLIDACRSAMRGEPFLYPAAVSAFVRRYLEEGEPDPPPSVLTEREAQVVKLIAEGASSKEIAQALTISVHTVERHRENVLRKLGMRDRVALTRFAVRHGLIEP
jgi:DNA-binding NarL/FixJ family response regulator/signal transduction histidine kinase